MKPVFIVLIVIGAIVLLVCIAGFFIGNAIYSSAMNRHSNLPRAASRAKNASPDKPLVTRGDNRAAWLEEIPVKDVYIESFDGLKLYAKLLENEAGGNSRFLIVCHGYTGHPHEMAHYAEQFYGKGYSALLPAARGHDLSEGDNFTMGWYERFDIAKWIDYLNTNYGSPEIVLLGISMGAATVMMATGEDLPGNVKCAIEDCGFSSVKEELTHCLKNMLKIPCGKLMLAFARPVIKAKTGIDINKDGITTDQLKKSKTPTLFIHGTDDGYVPFSMLDVVYDAHPGLKEKCVIEGAAHASCVYKDPETYWNSVWDFTDKYVSE